MIGWATLAVWVVLALVCVFVTWACCYWVSRGLAWLDRRTAPPQLEPPTGLHAVVTTHRPPLPGAAEGGSTYVHREDDWFDERLSHPDRPDEDF